MMLEVMAEAFLVRELDSYCSGIKAGLSLFEKAT